MKTGIFIFVAFLWLVTRLFGQDYTQIDQVFSRCFDTISGCFVLYDLEEDQYYYYNRERAGTRFPPMSTFKIVNSLIALETGVLINAESSIAWDSNKVPCDTNWNFYPATEWCRDHSLSSAFRYSVVWFFQEVARRIGHDPMETYLQKINYGNGDIQAGIDNFWFWKLKVSATEQVEFLRKLYLEDLDFDPEHIDVVKDIMIQEETEDYILYGKTGGGRIDENTFIGWYVGFVETADNILIFAINIDAADFIMARDLREKITREIFKAIKVI